MSLSLLKDKMMMMKVFVVLLLLILNVSCFEEIFLEVEFDEEQENGTIVIDLEKEIPSLSRLSMGYQIKFVRPCLNLTFDKLKIRSLKIDREEVCPYEINCSFICHLIIQKEEIKLIKLKLNINDINDHKPKFSKRNYIYEIINENNFHLQLEEAEDKDYSNKNSIVNYYLNEKEENNFPFKLNFNKENHLLELILIKNKINKQNYFIQLFVIDGQNQTDFCFIQINIKENYLFSPKFDFNLYQFYITNLNQSFIGQIKAKNHLDNNLTEIYYRLINSQQNLFEINQKNGKIFIKDFNEIQNHFYEIFVEAFYLNYISTLTTVHVYFNLTSSTSVEEEKFIEILIPKLFQRNGNDISIKENSSVPLTILQIFISSSSSSEILKLNSSLHRDDFQLKQLDEQSFEFILLKSFDYEITKIIQLNFYLFNSSIQKSIEIYIENINDCQPYFNQTNYLLQITENNQIPFLLHTFQAFDQDNLDHLEYQLENIDENIFLINSTNGQLWINKVFDRELKSNYSFQICVFDQIYRNCSNIFLEILDENDNICQFNSSLITININENLLSMTNIIQIQAFDQDYQENSTLTYSFNSSTSFLRINSTSGVIQTTTNSFDYEFIQFYSIEIKACDHFNIFPSFCCSTKLKININDLNDNLPFLIYPSSINQIFIIDYSNKTMPQLKANDKDLTNKNRFIFFEIIGGSLNSSLTIDHHSGQLHLLSSILPLFGTIHLSISSQTFLQLTLLIHDNQTNPQLFLRSIQQQQQQQSFQLLYFVALAFLLVLFLSFLLFFYFWKQKRKGEEDRLMNTPSTTTLSARSISNSTNKKLYETYHSFGESFLSPQPTQV